MNDCRRSSTAGTGGRLDDLLDSQCAERPLRVAVPRGRDRRESDDSDPASTPAASGGRRRRDRHARRGRADARATRGVAGVPLPLGARVPRAAPRFREPAALEGRRSRRGHGSVPREGRQGLGEADAERLRAILRAAMESTEVSCGPNDYVIPNRRPASVRRAERSNKMIWETVVRVGERVGVRATVHALRRAFAVAFLTTHPGAIESLQALMNHSRIDTTQEYLRALNKSKAMEAVRDLSWGSGFRRSPGGAYGIRTRATAVRGRRPRPLDECARRGQGSEREVKEERRPTGRRSSATWGHAGGHFPEPQEDLRPQSHSIGCARRYLSAASRISSKNFPMCGPFPSRDSGDAASGLKGTAVSAEEDRRPTLRRKASFLSSSKAALPGGLRHFR